MASMNTRLNIEKLDGNIVQKHGGSKQVGLKQLGSKQVGFKQLGVKQVCGSMTVDNQPEKKTNTDCLIKEQEKEYQTWWKIKTGTQQHNGLVDETNVTLFANVRCFLIQSGLSKVFWLDDVTSKVVLYRAGLQEVQTQDLMDYQLARDREQHLAYELFGYREDSNEATFVVAAVENIYAHESLTFNNTVACEAEIWATKGLLAKAKGNILSMKIVSDHSGNTLRVSQSRFYNGKLVQTLLEGHSILLLEGSLSGDCDVEKNGKWSCIYAVGSQEYQMVCTRLDIASADVGMLDKFNRGLQTDGCVVSWKAMLQHVVALSTTKAEYMALTEAVKEAIWHC
nr:zinc finger, CCHC-type [Tanacetum cinerariifolium]